MAEVSDKPRNRRRWWLIAAGLLLCLAPPVISWVWLTRDPFAAEVRRVGGKYTMQTIESRLATLELFLMGKQPTVFHWIDLEHSRADDAWLAKHREQIAQRKNLSLSVRNSGITARGLAELRGLENISSVNCTGTRLTDDAIDTIVTLPNVVQLYIGQTGIADTALAGLSRSPHLNFLCIDRTQATDQGLAVLQNCRTIEGLWILDADDDTARRVAQHRGLK